VTFKSRFGLPRQLTITRVGWFYVALTVGLGAAGINTGNNLVMLTCGLMLGLIIASGVLSERCLRGLAASRELPMQLAAGTPSLVSLVLRNDKAAASFGVLVTELSHPGRSQFPLVRGGESERRAYLLTPSARGTLRFGSLRISTRFPFGLFEKSLVIDLPQEAWVAPASQPGGSAVHSPREGPGNHGASIEGPGLDPWELRPHRDGEDVRHIAWAQSARAGRLLSLTRERDGLAEVRLHLRQGLAGQTRERHLAQLRFTAETLLGEGISVGLVGGAAGELTIVPPGLGPIQADRILQVLAREPGGASSAANSGDFEKPLPAAHPLKTSPFLRWQRVTLFAVAAIAFAASASSQELPWEVVALFALTWLAAFPTRERASAAFARVLNLVTLALLVVLALLTVTRSQSIPLSAAEAGLLLCANRLLVRRTPADDALLLLSCFLSLAAGATLGGQLEYGICLLGFCALVAPALTFSELRRGIEEEAPAQASALMAAPELTAPRLVAFTAVLGIGALAFAIGMFPLFPRAQLGLLQSLAFGPRLTGVSDQVDLTAGGDLQASSKLVLVADVAAGDPRVLHYFRTVTLSHFTGSGWLPAATRRSYTRVFALPKPPVVSGVLEPFLAAGDLIPVPEGLTHLRAEGYGAAFWLDDQGNLHLSGAPAADLTLLFDAAADRINTESGVSPEDTLLPEVSTEVRSFAERLIPEGSSPAEASRRVAEGLAGFRYQLNTEGGPSPLDTFLRDKRGDCQLFATAAVVLLRLRGIPARYVGGYYLDSPKLGKNLVRAWDAHAWAEILTTEGPLLLDTTPPSERGGHHSRTDFWEQVQDVWQTAQFRWLRSVIDYDVGSQVRQARWLAQIGRSLWGFPRLGISLGRAGMLALVAALAWLLIRLARRSRDPARALQNRLFARLAELGLERRPAMTYDEALVSTEQLSPELARRSAPLLRRLGEARFGNRPLTVEEEGALGRAITRLSG
jgi:uncharacterized protein (DUF58 family)/transglutaminase-like putative cysteine protease